MARSQPVLETVVQRLGHAASQSPSKSAIRGVYTKGRTENLTFWQWFERAARVACALVKFGLKRGEPVALVTESGPNWAIAAYGILMAGGAAFPISSRLPVSEVRRLIDEVNAQAAFMDEPFADEITAGIKPLPWLCVVGNGQQKAPRALSWADVLAHSMLPCAETLISGPDDPAFLLCTAGTTGGPKVVRLTHRNISSNLAAVVNLLTIRPRDVILSIAPFNHVMGLMTVDAAAWTRATLVFTDDYKTLSDTARREQVTFVLAVPKFYSAMSEKILAQIRASAPARLLHQAAPRLVGAVIRRRISPRLRALVSGAAVLDPAVITGLERLGLKVINGYGMTETAPVITVRFPGDPPDSVGSPLPGVEVRIVQGPDSAPSEGEIQVRGPGVMAGYHGSPAASGVVLSPDGWLNTGDCGRIKDNKLFITGRAKDIIALPTGQKVHPAKVERALKRAPGVENAVVFRGRDANGDEIVKAAIYPTEEYRSQTGPQVALALWPGIQASQQKLEPFERVRLMEHILISLEPLAETAKGEPDRRHYAER